MCVITQRGCVSPALFCATWIWLGAFLQAVVCHVLMLLWLSNFGGRNLKELL